MHIIMLTLRSALTHDIKLLVGWRESVLTFSFPLSSYTSSVIDLAISWERTAEVHSDWMSEG